MKVIGESENGYLISATEKEIKNIFGFGWSEEEFTEILKQNLPRYSSLSRSLVGLEIKPSVAFLRISWLKRRSVEFKNLCNTLRKTAEMIEQHEPLFDAIAADKDKQND